MKLTKGQLTGGSMCGDYAMILTVRVPEKVYSATIGEQIVIISESRLGENQLTELHNYLIDRPALMDDDVVKQGIYAIRKLLNIPTPLSEL